MTEKTIKDLLANYESKPSTKCWEALSHRLDAVMPTGRPAGQQPAAAEPVTQAPAVRHHVAHAFRHAGTKIAAAVLGTAAVATATVMIVVNTNKDVPAGAPRPAAMETDTLTESGQDLTAEIEDKTCPVDGNLLSCTNRPAPTAAAGPAGNKTAIGQTNATGQAAGRQNAAHGTAAGTQAQVSAGRSQTAQSSAAAGRAGGETAGRPDSRSGKPAIEQARPAPAAAAVAETPPAGRRPARQPVAQPPAVQDDPALQGLPDDAIDCTPPAKIEIPNVFTPNGDGINDYFVILGLENCIKRRLTVRNRANRTVYKSDSYENRWAGDGCPDGMYHYQFVFNNGTVDQQLSGVVYIVRE